MLFHEVAETSRTVASTPARLAKAAALAECLRRAEPGEVAIVTTFLQGQLRQRRTGLGYAALRDLPEPAPSATLSVSEVDAEFARLAALSGAGSTGARRSGFRSLLARATAAEQHLLAGLVAGEVRQGALDGVLTEAVALAAKVPAGDVRRAVTVGGALVPVAEAVLADGAAGLARFRLVVGSALRPMLASPTPGIAEAMAQLGTAAVEWKLDGVRVQIHRDAGEVRVFTRTLDDITSRVPELVEATLALPVTSIVLDGEAIALAPDGRAQPFQRTASRMGRSSDVETARREIPLSVFLFDCLFLDGDDLVGAPAHGRWAALSRVTPAELRVPRIVTADVAEAQTFFADAVHRGHEGVVAKALDAPYEAGRRGASWLKAKPRHTLDLVVLAVEWGHGRREGWLSNLHLGALDPAGRYGPPGGFVMLGKTFKGLTDAMLTWQTERLKQLADGPTDGWVVTVAPELVVEVAFDGVQTSPRYPAGLALRFARVLRHRPDKPASDANTIETLEAIHAPTASAGPG